jgi:hypothetical protein
MIKWFKRNQDPTASEKTPPAIDLDDSNSELMHQDEPAKLVISWVMALGVCCLEKKKSMQHCSMN